ncbi:MAG: hypothetical protein PHG23_00770 [Candidatus Pacebacteria bacterium]|nr:hypothetical protein [Candidatus Paceibacterota bacterium]
MNKKILSLFAILAVLTVVAVPVFASQTIPTSCTMSNNVGIQGCPSSGECSFENNNAPCGVCCLLNSVYTVTNWIFIGLLLLAALFIIIGAVTFVTSAGDATKTTQAKNYILYAAIGIAVALFSRAVPSLVKAVLGVGTGA